MGRFKPDYYLDDVFLVPYEELWQRNIRSLIFDIDNTLAAYEDTYPPAKTMALIKRLKYMGFKICLLTNNSNARLKLFTNPLAVEGSANALKPFARGVRKAIKLMDTKPKHTAIIGDQLLADIWAGKRAGITTVLVKPITNKDLFFVRFRRMVEAWLLKRYYG